MLTNSRIWMLLISYLSVLTHVDADAHAQTMRVAPRSSLFDSQMQPTAARYQISLQATCTAGTAVMNVKKEQASTSRYDTIPAAHTNRPSRIFSRGQDAIQFHSCHAMPRPWHARETCSSSASASSLSWPKVQKSRLGGPCVIP